jgi:hypothetical protein
MRKLAISSALDAPAMARFVRLQNIEHYRRLLADPDNRDATQVRTIVKLLADEEARES